MDKPTKNTSSLTVIAVVSLFALVFAAAFAFETYSHSQQYKDCIAKGDLSRDQCRLLYPAQRGIDAQSRLRR